MNPLVVIVGPTATGKSRLALQLARRFGGEIVNADSRLVYRYMDIGTAKPGRDETTLVPHHLIDIINPDEDFNLAQYQRLVSKTVVDIQERGKLPLLVGGSGLYVWGVVEGWQVPEVAPDPAFRRQLEGRVERGEVNELFRELEQIDPAAAARVDRLNPRRVIRALEIARDSKASQPRKVPPPYDILIIGLTTGRSELYRRIDTRVDGMIEQGLADEVKKLLEMGYSLELPAMSSIGYKQIGLFSKGEMTLEDAVQQIKTETHRLVRRQYNWFRLKDERIKWFDIEDAGFESGVEGLVEGFINDN